MSRLSICGDYITSTAPVAFLKVLFCLLALAVLAVSALGGRVPPLVCNPLSSVTLLGTLLGWW